MFPFNNLYKDLDFKQAIGELCPQQQAASLTYLYEHIFNPFEVYDKFNSPLFDLDIHINYMYLNTDLNFCSCENHFEVSFI